MKTTPVTALQVEMGEMPLHIRRDQLALVYWANPRGHKDDHISKSVLVHCQEKEKAQLKSFGWVIEQKAREMGLHELDVCPTICFPTVPLWLLSTPTVDLGLLDLKEREGISSHTAENHIRSIYGDSVVFFTDASRTEANSVGVAFAIPSLKIFKRERLNNSLSVYTAELVAMLIALSWVECNKPKNKVLIASDSSSTLVSIQNAMSKSRLDIVLEIIQLIDRLQHSNIKVVFLWVPAHIGVRGNELAVGLAKKDCELPQTSLNIRISKAEIQRIVKMQAKDKWKHVGQ